MNDGEELFTIVYIMCCVSNTPGITFIQPTLDFDDTVNQLASTISAAIARLDTATKYMTYKSELKPSLNVHEVYVHKVYILDYICQALTRLRLMSHDVKVEPGWWNRTLREQRRCHYDTGAVSTKCYVPLHFTLT